LNDIPDIAPMAEAAEEKRRAKAGERPLSTTVKLYAAEDILLGVAALDEAIKAGMPLDKYSTVRAIFERAGVISSRPAYARKE
jgi:hypothetical protein